MNFFKRARTPEELVLKCCNAYEELAKAGSTGATRQAALDHVVKYMGEMKTMQFGDPTTDKAPKDEDGKLLAQEAAKSKLLTHMCTQLTPLGFETRKDVAQVFCGLLRRTSDGPQPCIDYLLKHTQLLGTLIDGYEHGDTALISGSMIRECVKNTALAKHVMESPAFYTLLAYTDVAVFEVASDAFLAFKELLSRHGALTTAFLLDNSPKFFTEFNSKLLLSKNYVTKRQSLKLLGELLLTPGNVEVMMRYINDVGHLMIIMQLLRDSSRAIQFEAFHIFKVFVANPSKQAPVIEILKKNADKLLRYLSDFQSDREDDEFANEKAVLSKVLKALV